MVCYGPASVFRWLICVFGSRFFLQERKHSSFPFLRIICYSYLMLRALLFLQRENVSHVPDALLIFIGCMHRPWRRG
jgi:hypothetical protein